MVLILIGRVEPTYFTVHQVHMWMAQMPIWGIAPWAQIGHRGGHLDLRGWGNWVPSIIGVQPSCASIFFYLLRSMGSLGTWKEYDPLFILIRVIVQGDIHIHSCWEKYILVTLLQEFMPKLGAQTSRTIRRALIFIQITVHQSCVPLWLEHGSHIRCDLFPFISLIKL